MRKAFPYLLLLFAAYAAWYYWTHLPTIPLQAALLPINVESIDRVQINALNKEPFTLSITSEGWMVENAKRSQEVRTSLPDSLLRYLLRLESDGVDKKAKPPMATVEIDLQGDQVREKIAFYPTAVAEQWLVRLNDLPELYRVPNFSLDSYPLTFEDYRNDKMLDLTSLTHLDSVVWEAEDDLRVVILQQSTDGRLIDSLHRAWQQMFGNNYATFFDEIEGRQFHYGDYLFYGSKLDDPIRLSVYANTDWPKPYVLNSSQQPLDFFSAEELPWPVNSLRGFPGGLYETVVFHELKGRPGRLTRNSLQQNRAGKSLTLNKSQVEAFLNILNDPNSYGGDVAACHDPRHGFEFKDKLGRVFAYMSLCMACNNIYTKPALVIDNEPGRKGFNIDARHRLRDLFGEWGVNKGGFSNLFDDELVLREELIEKGIEPDSIEVRVAEFQRELQARE